MMRWWLVLVMACGGGDRVKPMCYSASDCAQGDCIDGQCTTAAGRCRFSMDCRTGYCVDGSCANGKLGTACNENFHCDSRSCVDARCAKDTVGAKCADDGECKGIGIHCFRSVCRRFGAAGAACDLDGDCAGGLTCLDHTCMSEEDQRKRTARLEEAARQREAANQARMLAESGVTVDPKQVERGVAPPPGPGQRVRTVEVGGMGAAFAACRASERLVGGSCKPVRIGTNVTSYPSGHGAEDTVGARWNCDSDDPDVRITAYALCMKLP